ncbi:MAG: TolC family protein, partial [Bacteroidota bacterium]|nr:TolC family protein [Bacteroidota bacterium]
MKITTKYQNPPYVTKVADHDFCLLYLCGMKTKIRNNMAVTTLKSRILAIALLMGSIASGERMAAQAPAGKRLLLKEAVSSAMANNTSLKVSGLEAQIAKSNYRQTDAILLPHVELGYTAMATNNPLNAFGFKLQQENVTAADFDPTRLNNPGNTKDFSAKVEVMQPLINVDTY